MVRKAFPARVLISLAIAFVVLGGVVAAGAALRTDKDNSADAAAAGSTTTTERQSREPSTTTSTIPAVTTPTIPALIQPAARTDLPVVPYEGFGDGDTNPIIQAYETRLLEIHIDPGAVDGHFDQNLVYAVQAVQKVMGFPRSGRLGPGEAAALANFQYPAPLHPTAEPNRTEINIVNQTITLFENYQVRQIVTTSTASGVTFCYNTPKKAPTAHICEVATTPNGRYAYYLYRDGNDTGDLGTLFNPYYFFKGRAIHGYPEVPTEPASHGCARIPMNVATYWHTLVHDGDAVYVDGGPANAEQIISSSRV
jgi:peptidoglycan hydrolase-like protein with peptidoglycan-binding domain